MPVIRITVDRDVEDSTHMNVAIGNGMSLAFFDFPHVARLQRRAPEGVGNVMHTSPFPSLGACLTRLRGAWTPTASNIRKSATLYTSKTLTGWVSS